MKKLLILIVGVVELTGWGSHIELSRGGRTGQGSPKAVAEDFAQAIIQRDPDKALEFFDAVEESRRGFVLRPKKQRDDLKKKLEDLGHEINVQKLGCEAILEDIMVPPEFYGYHLVNGKKYTGETARVLLQFVKGDVKKSDGLEIALMKVDGSWKVTDYKEVSGFDASSEDAEREDKKYAVKSEPVKAKPVNLNGMVTAKEMADKENRVKKYERLCGEVASILRRDGNTIPENAIEKEVEKFRNLSKEKQEAELKAIEEALEYLKKEPRAKDADKKAK